MWLPQRAICDIEQSVCLFSDPTKSLVMIMLSNNAFDQVGLLPVLSLGPALQRLLNTVNKYQNKKPSRKTGIITVTELLIACYQCKHTHSCAGTVHTQQHYDNSWVCLILMRHKWWICPDSLASSRQLGHASSSKVQEPDELLTYEH